MKKTYEKPAAEILTIKSEDIITESNVVRGGLITGNFTIGENTVTY